MPYTINQSGAVTSLTIVKLNAIDYAQRSQQQGFDDDLSRIFIVEGGVGGGSSLGGGGSAAVDIATTSKAGIVMVPASGGLVVGRDGSIGIGANKVSITNTTASSSTTSGALTVSGGVGVAGNIYAAKVYGAVWNDYAEYRVSNKEINPGRVVYELGNDAVELSKTRLMYGCSIVSDTYGFAIGETNKAKTPLAVSGRVLAYTYENRDEYRTHIGDFVCSGPNGTVSIMTKEEIQAHPQAVIGSISAVPDYESWGSNNVPVDGRVWIKVR